MTVSALINDFLKHLQLSRNTSKLTIRNYDHYLKRFLEFAGDMSPKDIDLDLIRKYKLHLARWADPESKKPLKKITQNYFLIALRVFLRFLAQIGVQTLPAKQVVLGKCDPMPLSVLDETQLKLLLSAPDISKKDGVRNRAILETLFSTGLRVSELTSLNRDIINFAEKEFKIVGKGGKERQVSLSDEACEWLKKYLSFRQDTFKPLFIRFQGKVNPRDGGLAMRLTPRSIERIVEKYVNKLRFSIKATPHTLRHSFAADLLTSGADIHSVQQILGHFNLSTTQIYTNVTNTNQKDA